MTRRELMRLLVLAAGAPLWLTTRTVAAAQPEGRAAARPLDWIPAGLGESRSAGLLGREYLATVPWEADREVLRRLLPRLDHREAAGDAPGEPLRRWVRDDFDAGRVVSVRGWLLSRTEARLCALVALGA